MNDLTMCVRYGMMMLTGILIREGYIDSSMTEPMIGLGVAIAVMVWKKLEAKAQKNPGV